LKDAEVSEEKNFSLVLGGPFFQLLHRARLTGDVLELLKKRILTISLFAWLPLLILSIANGQAWGSESIVPFAKDIDSHIRFLVALPLLIIAEVIVHKRISAIVSQFTSRKLIPEESLDQFNKAISSAYRWRNSLTAEALMLVLIYFVGYQFVWGKTTAVTRFSLVS
jgi:F0F1-type ATP synthase membrane subunit a